MMVETGESILVEARYTAPLRQSHLYCGNNRSGQLISQWFSMIYDHALFKYLVVYLIYNDAIGTIIARVAMRRLPVSRIFCGAGHPNQIFRIMARHALGLQYV